jgi:hypothetical protein
VVVRGVFFGLEYDNDPVPNAIVIPGTRSGKFVKWVKEYQPKLIVREDGKEVLRERRVVQMPERWRLRKDEVKGEMKRHKTENWQDGKFFVVELHSIGVHLHPLKAKMEKEAKEKKDAADALKRSDGVQDPQPPVAEGDTPATDKVTLVKSAGGGSDKPVQ